MFDKIFEFIKKLKPGTNNANCMETSNTLTNQLTDYNYIIKRIKSFRWAHNISEQTIIYISDECLKERWPSEIAKEIPDFVPGISISSAESLAKTVWNILSTNSVRLKAQDIGLNWYVWKTCGDSTVRESHKLMDRVLVNWNDPPSPEALSGKKYIGCYHAGEILECRCYPEPLTSIDQVKWPHLIYQKGSILRITKTQFKNIF